MKIAYVTDSGTGRSAAEYKKEGIICYPLEIVDGEKSYEDMETISYPDVYRLLDEGHILHTSQPAYGRILNSFKELKKDGFDMVIAVPLCTGLSGTMNSMAMAAEETGLQFVGIDTYVTAVVEDYLIHRVKELAEAGKSIEEIKALCKEVIDSCNTLVIPKTLTQLERSGRLTPMAAKLGSLLRICPVLQINKSTEGKVDTLEKVRTFRKAIDRAVEQFVKDGADCENEIIAVAHVNNTEDAQMLSDRLKEQFPRARHMLIELCNPVAVHTGNGTLGLQHFHAL